MTALNHADFADAEPIALDDGIPPARPNFGRMSKKRIDERLEDAVRYLDRRRGRRWNGAAARIGAWLVQQARKYDPGGEGVVLIHPGAATIAEQCQLHEYSVRRSLPDALKLIGAHVWSEGGECPGDAKVLAIVLGPIECVALDLERRNSPHAKARPRQFDLQITPRFTCDDIAKKPTLSDRAKAFVRRLMPNWSEPDKKADDHDSRFAEAAPSAEAETLPAEPVAAEVSSPGRIEDREPETYASRGGQGQPVPDGWRYRPPEAPSFAGPWWDTERDHRRLAEKKAERSRLVRELEAMGPRAPDGLRDNHSRLIAACDARIRRLEALIALCAGDPTEADLLDLADDGFEDIMPPFNGW